MKHFARDTPIAAQKTRPAGVAGGRPRDPICLDSDDLKLVAESWGATYADNLICDARWPRCNQSAAIAAAEAILRTAIIDVAAILNTGIDFRPHVAMMSAATWLSFQNSMPRGKMN